MKKYAIIGIVALLLILSGVGIGLAQTQEPIELQPYYLLTNGEFGSHGAVYALDGGWLAVTSEGTIFTCGCEECDGTELFTYATPISPTDTPFTDPTPIPPTSTPVAEDKEKANCGLGNGPEGADPNENACGKKTGEDNE